MSTLEDKRLGRNPGNFDTREELEAAVVDGHRRMISIRAMADDYGVSRATIGRILNPGLETKNKVAREEGTNPLIPLMNSLWVVRETA